MTHYIRRSPLTTRLFSCAGFVISDPFDECEAPVRFHLLVWASDEEDASDISPECFYELEPDKQLVN